MKRFVLFGARSSRPAPRLANFIPRGVFSFGLALAFSLGPAARAGTESEQKLVGNPTEANANFGTAVATDGEVILVGARYEDHVGINDGAAYLFEWDGSQWAETRRLLANDAAAAASFGRSLALSGNTLLVGATGCKIGGQAVGAVYVFERTPGTTADWQQAVKIVNPALTAGNDFGFGCALDGDTAVVGMSGDDTGATDAGSAYVFERNQGGANAWGQVKKLIPPDPAELKNFGTPAISGDTIVIGARGKNNGVSTAGAVYIYDRNQGGTGQWGLVKKLQLTPAAINMFFGCAVGIQGDLLVVGALGVSSYQGRVYVYGRNTGGANNWGLLAELSPDTATSERFGASVALHDNRLAVGASSCSDLASNAGAVYLFDSQDAGGSWQLVSKTTASDGLADDNLGTAVALADNALAVSAPYADPDGLSSAGAVYVYSTHEDLHIPSLPDLLAVSDTGAADDDDLTRLNNDGAAVLQFQVAATVPGATVSLYLDGTTLIGSATATETTTTITTNGTDVLADGSHQITARQTVEGTESPASPALALTIDTQAPDAPGAPDMQAASDTGAADDDNLTSDATPTFDVAPGPGCRFRFLVDGDQVSGDYESGTAYTIPAFDNGEHTAAVAAVDLAGNVSAASPALVFTIDTQAPAQPAAPDLQAASDTGAADDDNLTSDTTPTFSVNPATPYFRFRRNGVQIGGDYESGSEYTVGAETDGTHHYAVAAVDAAGNVSPFSDTIEVRIDTQAPTVGIAAISPDPRYAAVAQAAITFSEPVADFTLANLSLGRDGSANLLTGGESLSSNDNAEWLLTGLAALTATPGSYELALAATGIADPAGNPLATGTAETWTVVEKALAITVADGWEGGTAAGTVTIPLALGEDLAVTFTVDDATEAGEPAGVTIAAGTTSQAFTVPLLDDQEADGAQTVVITASAPGFADGTGTLAVRDATPHHFVFETIPSPQQAGVALIVTVKAKDMEGNTLALYTGTASLRASSDLGPIQLSQSTTEHFAEGVWTGSLHVDGVADHVVIEASAGTASGFSNAFDSRPGPFARFEWSPIPSPRYANSPFRVTITAQDANGYTVPTFAGPADIMANVFGESETRTVGTDTNTDMYIPLYVLHSRNRSQCIYQAAQMGASGWITSISYYQGNILTIGQTLTDTMVRARHTPLAKFSSSETTEWEDAANLQVLFNGTWQLPNQATGWRTITLNRPFRYNGTDNLMLDLCTSFQPVGSQAGLWRCTYQFSDVVCYYSTGLTNYGEPHTWTGTTVFKTTSTHLPNTQFTVVSATPFPVAPTSIPVFESGSWTGMVTVGNPGTNVTLTADDGMTSIGHSNPIDVVAATLLTLSIPSGTLTEGGEPLTGTVTAAAAPAEDLTVLLFSSRPEDAAVPTTVTIPAGETSTSFTVTPLDNANLDGPRNVVIRAEATGHSDTEATLSVLDDETTTLSLSIPAAASEGDGTLVAVGRLTLGEEPAADITVQITATPATELRFPPALVVPAGQLSVPFNLTIIDDGAIDGLQTVQLTASVAGWASAIGTITIADNETTEITLAVPASALEGDGMLAAAGTATIPGTWPTDLEIRLASSDTTELRVPAAVVIPAGQTSVSFDLEVVDDMELDDHQTVTLAATATGFAAGEATIIVQDNEPHHFVWSAIADPQRAGAGFAVTITAVNIDGLPVAGFREAATITAQSGGAAVSATPSTTAAFTDGVWSGTVTILAVADGVQLTATSGSLAGTSGTFAVTHGPFDHFAWEEMVSPRYQGYAFPTMLRALDEHGFTVADYAGTVSLRAYEFTSSEHTIWENQTSTNGSSSSSIYYHRGICFVSVKRGPLREDASCVLHCLGHGHGRLGLAAFSCFLPPVRQEFLESAGGVVEKPAEDVGEVLPWADFQGAAGLHQREQGGHALPCRRASQKHPVLASDRELPEAAFRRVVLHPHVRVAEV